MKAAVTGTFDGVHRGHQFLLSALKKEATARGLEPIAVTFSQHPLSVIAPYRVPERLGSLAERKAAIKRQGVGTIVLDFNEELRGLTAEEYLGMLNQRYGINLLLLGFNNRIGSDQKGAKELAGRSIAGVEVLAADEHPTLPVSSSAIRTALSEGNITAANRMLGRPYTLSGRIVKGKQIGRTLGFPTANLEPENGLAIPAPGVYVGEASGHISVINIGRRPTVEGRNDAPISIEAHLIDYSGNLYGTEMQLKFFARLRGEKKFSSIEELKKAISNDIEKAREYEQ